MSADKPLKILLVDDSGMARTMITTTLNSIGYHDVVTATDGIDAVQQLQTGAAVDCIISDWNMPSMDGLTFLKWLRSQREWKSVPFLMATAQSDKKQVALAMAAGATQVLTKPFPPEELKRVLDAVFGVLGDESAAGAASYQPQYAASGKLRLRIVHTVSLEQLAIGVLSAMTRKAEITPSCFELKTMGLPSLNSVQSSLENGRVDAAFLPAPMAMDLYGYGIPLTLVCLGNRNGGRLVRNKVWSNVPWPSHKDYFKYKAVLIPHKMSLYNMLLYRFLREEGLRPGVPGHAPINVRFEVIPPAKMPEFMAYNENVAAFAGADPMGELAIRHGIAEPMFPTAALWANHPGDALVVRDEFVAAHPECVRELVRLLFEVGGFLADSPRKAAELAVEFIDPQGTFRLDVSLTAPLLTGPHGLNTRDLAPDPAELEEIQQYMHNEMEIGGIIDVSSFVEPRFAAEAAG